MLLYFAIQQINFELRWRFVVSSLLQQKLPSRVKIMLDCAILEGYQNKYLFPAKHCPFLHYYQTPRRTFAKRGYVRNLQVARAVQAGADWIYFGDADHLYPPEYVAAIYKFCRRHRMESRVVYDWSKFTVAREEANALVAHPIGWAVPDAYERAQVLPRMYKAHGLHAGGAMQLARLAAILDKNCGRYIHPRYRRSWDRNMFRGQRARSDWQFRSTMGEYRVLLDTRPPIHLDHLRDKELSRGKHSEEQR